MIKKISINRLNYTLYLSIFLSFVTLIISIFSPIFSLRLIYNSINLFLANTIFLMSMGILSESTYEKGLKQANGIFFLTTTFYMAIYILVSIVFINTLQVTRIQTLFFFLKTNPLYVTAITSIFIFLLVALISKGLQKTIRLNESKKSKHKKIKLIILLLIISLLMFNLVFYPRNNVEDELVRAYKKGRTILFEVEKYNGEEIINYTQEYKNFNVVLILLESVSADRVHFYGYDRNITPNIDWFAQNGISFENAYTTATHSDYAQPAFISSNHILENNYRNLFSEQKNQNSIWQIFDKEGYNTYYFSAQDDSWAGMYKYFNHSSLNVYWHSLTDGKTDYGSGFGKKDYDETTINEAIKTLNEKYIVCNNTIKMEEECKFEKEKPFFLYLNFQATHDPFNYPEGNSFFNEKTDKEINKYDNALKYVDMQIGKLKEYLNKNNLINETIVIISSDHGHDLYSEHSIKGHGLSVYDEELKVPLIFYLPKEKNSSINERVGTINVLPTLLEIMKIEEPKGLRGSTIKENERIFFYTQSHRYIIGMIEKEIKTIIDLNKNTVEIYNLNKDPKERNNLYKTNNYDKQILTLLMWHNCQLNYFSKEERPLELKKYCDPFEKS